MEPDISDKPAYIGEPDDEPRAVSYYRHWNKAYARSLMSVDRNVRELVEAQMARDPGLDDTLFLFIGDNGLEIGNHRRLGKAVPYEESIHVPLLAQGYGMVPGTVDDLVTNVDVLPTILQAAGGLTAPWDDRGHVAVCPRSSEIRPDRGRRRRPSVLRGADATQQARALRLRRMGVLQPANRPVRACQRAGGRAGTGPESRRTGCMPRPAPAGLAPSRPLMAEVASPIATEAISRGRPSRSTAPGAGRG